MSTTRTPRAVSARPAAPGTHVVRVGPVTILVHRRSLVVGGAALVTSVVLLVIALGTGTYPASPAEVLQVLSGTSGDAMLTTVVAEWRLPRAVAALGVGALLGIAGALFQTVTRNPLASPDVLGLSSGAFTGMLLTLALVSSSSVALVTGSLIGALGTAAAIWLLAWRGGLQGFRLIVVGIGVAAMLASLNTWILLQVELETAMFASAWGMGSLNGVTAGPVLIALLGAAPVAAAAVALAPRLRQIALGDDVASATGARPHLVRTLALLVGVVLVAAATTVAGPVAFVALSAPQISRLLARSPSLSLGLSAAIGAVLLLGSDLVAQHLLPSPLPVGVVTVSVGGAYLVAMIVLEIRRRA